MPYQFSTAKVLWAVLQIRLDIGHAVLDELYLLSWLESGLKLLVVI